MNNTISTKILEDIPLIDESAVDKLLAHEIATNNIKFVVLDDDPTGVQTVHGISVYTDWSVDSLKQGLKEDNKIFFVLTNSRGMTTDETTAIHKEISENLLAASIETGIQYSIISRSDSTLRGHYPLETEILRQGYENNGKKVDGEILCFFFKEGGRYTLNNIHYVKYGDQLVPAAETEFAKDKTFGYANSAIPDYIEEKTKGEFPASSVTCITLDDLRQQRYDEICQKLMQVQEFGKVCVNAIDYSDVKVFAVALYRAIAKGKCFLFRSAACLVKVIGGVSDIPLLTRDNMILNDNKFGGLVVAGSYTNKTTAQLKELLTLEDTVSIEFNSDLVLDGDEALSAEVDRCIATIESVVSAGKVAVCYTNRKFLILDGDTKESVLIRSVKISDALQRLVGQLKVTPLFVVAKGGITSSTIGTDALHVQRALVLGQICPGIPVWRLGSESKFPSIPYVIFPGNVGDENTLKNAVKILIGE